jgi:hypothetical protein
MLFGLPLVIVIWNPSNYYSHFVFLLALLGSTATRKRAAEEEAAAEAAAASDDPKTPIQLVVPMLSIAGPLLGLCVAGYWVSLEPDLERHFQDTTVTLIVTLAFIFANSLKRDPFVKSVLGRPTPAPAAGAAVSPSFPPDA